MKSIETDGYFTKNSTENADSEIYDRQKALYGRNANNIIDNNMSKAQAKELAQIVAFQFVGRGIQEGEAMVGALHKEVVPGVAYGSLLNIAAGLGVSLLTLHRKFPAKARLPAVIVASKLLADEVASLGKRLSAKATFARASVPVASVAMKSDLVELDR